MIKFNSMKFNLAFLFFIFQISLYGQSTLLYGYERRCNTDEGSTPRVSLYTLKIDDTKDTKEYSYHFTKGFWLQGIDSLGLKEYDYSYSVTYFKKDSTLIIREPQYEKITGLKFKLLEITTDSLIKIPCFSYAFDDELYPDDQEFYLFHPSYGILKSRSRVWWWYGYFYFDGIDLIQNCICPGN
jgi:hypothetical protein